MDPITDQHSIPQVPLAPEPAVTFQKSAPPKGAYPPITKRTILLTTLFVILWCTGLYFWYLHILGHYGELIVRRSIPVTLSALLLLFTFPPVLVFLVYIIKY